MSFTLLSVAILGISAALIYRQVKWGYKHGLSRSLINLAVLVFCAFFSTLISVGIATLCEKLIMTIAEQTGLYALLEKFFASIIPATVVLLQMILSLLLFLPVFFLLRLVVSLVAKIIYGALVKRASKKRPQYHSENVPLYVKKDKQIGAALGVVSGFVLAVVIFAPLTGLLKSADGIVDIIKTNTDIPAIENSKELELLDKYSRDASGTVINACGGAALYDLTTRTTHHGHTTSLNKEIDTIKNIDIMAVKDKLAGEGGLTVSGITSLEPLLNDINKSVVLKLVIVEVIRDTSSAWMEHEPYLGMERPSIGTHKAMDEFLDQILYVCSTSTFDTYDADVRTLLNLLKLFQQNEAVLTAGDYSALVYAFNDGGFLQQVEAELDKNPHMTLVSFAINDMIMTVVAEEIVDTSRYSDIQRNMLYKEIAAALSNTQGLNGSLRDTEISRYLTESFSSFGVDVPTNINERISGILADEVPTMDGRVTDKEVKKFIDECVKGSD